MDAPTPAITRALARGEDLSLLHERLRLTPTERVVKNLQALRLVEALRSAKPIQNADDVST